MLEKRECFVGNARDVRIMISKKFGIFRVLESIWT